MLMKMMILSNMMITPMMNHPISMGSMMIIQTAILCMQQTTFMFTPWFSYIMFITMIGGMMVMFIYMASIASNEKFKPTAIIIMIWLISMTISFLLLKMPLSMTMTEQKLSMIMISMEEVKSTMKTYNNPKFMLTIMMMLTLLMTMISVTNISSSFDGPLKKTYVQT